MQFLIFSDILLQNKMISAFSECHGEDCVRMMGLAKIA